MENERLLRENARLTEELKKYQSDSLSNLSQKSEGQNQPMTTKLKTALGQNDAEVREQSAQRNLKFGDTVLAPVSTNSPLSLCRADNSNSKSITLETYNSLVTKYNLIFHNWTDIKATRTQLEKSLRAEKDKARRYNVFCDGLEKKLGRKRDRVRQLEERLRLLEDEVHNQRQSGMTEVANATKPRTNLGGTEDVRSTETRLSQVIVDGAVITSESPTPNNANITSYQIELPADKILRNSNCKNDQPCPNPMSDARHDEGIHSPLRDQLSESESNKHLMRLNTEKFGNVDANEVRSQPVDTQYTGSTEGNDNLSCPNITEGEGRSIKTESQLDVQSLHDTPVVIQERSIKKRNDRKNPTGTTKIKVETISSSPIGLAAFHGLEAHESIDLDDIGDKQITPRKQRSLRHKLSTPIPYGPRSVRNVRQEAGSDSVLKVRRVMEQTPINRDRLRAGSAPLSLPSTKQTLPKVSSSRATKRRRITTDIAIEELAGDGEIVGAAEMPPSRTETPESSGRLVELLENPMQSDHVAPDLFKDADDLGAYSKKSSTIKTRSSRSREDGVNMNEDPEDRPVRSRPLSKLSLHDFKINPNYNHGYDYAFTDVVRNQAERRCLPNCTKPECCGGAFRALAEAAWDPNRLPTASQEEVDTRLLEEFLGDNAYKIRNMTKAEKDETLLQAKTRELSNKHGKHRHAYERRRSPPGFWRVDFPSTQEEREDRQKGERLERDLVAQRYNEAMRPGGAYIFRDE